MKRTTTSKRLREYMEKFNVKQVDILKKAEFYTELFDTKLNKNDLSQYASGKVEPGQDKLLILSKAMNVSPTWLMGQDVPMHLKNIYLINMTFDFDKKESEVMEDNTILEIKELQEEIDYRTKIENEAIKLISECKFKEAIELLATI